MSLTSPLASPAEASFRPEDKALDMLFPPAEDPLTDSFSQYVNEALFDLSDDDKDFQFLGDIVDLFDKDSYTNGANGLPPSGTSARHSQSSPQPWRKGLWCLNGTSLSQAQTNADEQHCTSIEISKKAVALPCMRVASLDVIEQPCRSDTLGQTPPPSQPSSPLHCETKKMTLSPRLGSSRHHPYKRLDLDRSSSLSPAPVTATDQLKTIMAYQEPWHNTQQALQNFSFNPQDDNPPISPPPSGRAAQPTNMASVMQNSAVMPLSMLGSPDQYGPHQSQLIGEEYESQGFELPPTTAPVLPESHQQPIPSWTSDNYEPQSGTDFGYPMTGDLSSNLESQGWWAQTQSHDPSSQVQGTQQGYYPFLAAPVPHRPAHNLLQHGVHLQTSGLMIQCPDQINSDMSSPQAFSPSSFSPNTGGGFSPPSVYPPPPQQGQRFTQQPEHFNTPRRMSQQHPRAKHQQSRQQPPRSPSSSPSPSLSLSPTSVSRRSSSHSHSHSHSQSQSNRRNSHDRTVRRQKSSTHTHASTSSISKTPRTPRTPKSSSGGGGGRGRGSDAFVNLTQRDHEDILKAVAPSGSSKTREKRKAQEREEKRRRSDLYESERKQREALERKVRALSRDQSGEEGARGEGRRAGRVKREPEE
ncbi:MAG: hypothetical protein Q9160_000851 [Pyrenula sp. 1 TL-2023]